MSNFARAFQCGNCPRSNGEDGCPAWWEFVATDVGSGREVVRRECGLVALPTFLVEVIRAANRPAAAVESVRNEVASGLASVASAIAPAFAVAVERQAAARAAAAALPAARAPLALRADDDVEVGGAPRTADG